ncbi:MAG: acyl-CoA dehydrogenase family protein [Hyphomicrobiaceae bacterium]
MTETAALLTALSAAMPQPETRGLDVLAADPSLRQMLALYLPPGEATAVEPHIQRLARLVTTHLDDLAHAADKSPPVLRLRSRQGEDHQSLDKSPAYRELEKIAYGDLAMAALSHRPALGSNAPLSAATKYALFYLFAQAEFGLLCPVSMTDSLTRTIRKYAAPDLLDRYLPGLLAEEESELLQGAMFMTERFAGSDVGATETRAVKNGDHWRLWGDKWFCSNVDAGVSLVLARPEGAPPGTRGLGLFLMPRRLADGSANAYRIVRLKDKLGTRSMASGEIILEGAVGYLVGELSQGFKQMTEMVNQSRLSNAVRSAGMMRRAIHEAIRVATGRAAFGKPIVELPLARRQLIKMIVPAEQAISTCFYTGACLDAADAGDAKALRLRRILTPLVKFRACRDARKVTGDGMEMRGGTGYIEEWIEPRLVRDSHLGSIWEGTSNIIALDVIRAARKERAHEALADELRPMIAEAPGELAARLEDCLARTLALVDTVVEEKREEDARRAASALYHITSAALHVREWKALGAPLRLDLARLVLAHKLSAPDPLAPGAADDEAAADRVLSALVAAHRAA